MCKRSKCTEISLTILEKMPKKNEFQQKRIFDPEMSRCEETGIWNLAYVEGKRSVSNSNIKESQNIMKLIVCKIFFSILCLY